MLLLEPDQPAVAAVLVIHSWWGLTDSFRNYGETLRAAGFRVGLADLFDGATAATEAEARALRGRRRAVSMYRVLERDLVELRGEPESPSLTTGVVGFSMGGHWAVWLASRAQYRLSAAVLYYAARACEFHPGTCWQAHFAATDPWVSRAARRAMEIALRRSDCPYQSFDYPGTGHWFAESARPDAFDPDAAALARSRDLSFLNEALAPGD